MSKAKKKIFSERKWLNAADSNDTGSIQTRVRKGLAFVSAHLIITDCNRTVTLDFDACDKQELKERINKITLIENTIKNLKQALLEAKDVFD